MRYELNNQQVDQAEEQDGSGFLSFSCSNKLKTNEGCVIDLNSKINRIFLSSCMIFQLKINPKNLNHGKSMYK
jgi:hypothetical protein